MLSGIFKIILFLLIVHSTLQTVVFQIKLQFYNPKSTTSEITGRKCELYDGSTVCSPIFYFCFNQGNIERNCTSEEIEVGPYPRDSFIMFPQTPPNLMPNRVKNPFQFLLNEFTPNTTFVINVKENQTMMPLAYIETKLAELTGTIIPARNESVAIEKENNFTSPGRFMRFGFSVKIWCLQHYYGEKCLTYCKALNSTESHAYCNEQGDLMCLPGLIKPETNCTHEDNFCNNEEPCKNGAECFVSDDGYRCECQSGYAGENCTDILSTRSSTNQIITTNEEFKSTSPPRVSLPPTIDPSIIPDRNLSVIGDLDSQSYKDLGKIIKELLANQMKVDDSQLTFSVSRKSGESLEGLKLTIIIISVSFNGTSLSVKEINSHLFRNGKEWLSQEISQTVYVGPMKDEAAPKQSKKMDEAITITMALVCSIVILVVLGIVFIFMYNSYIKKMRIKHARVISSNYGVQFTKSPAGLAVNVVEEDIEMEKPTYSNPYDQPYSSASEYDYISIQKRHNPDN